MNQSDGSSNSWATSSRSKSCHARRRAGRPSGGSACPPDVGGRSHPKIVMIRAMDDQDRVSRERDALSEAYEQRTSQLHDARAALAEAVSTLRRELEQRRAEVEALRAQVAEL